MGNIFKVLRRDFLRLFKVPAAWVILFGMVFIPPLYSWYNIVGFWDPVRQYQGITVAIANNDDGTDNALIGKQNLGDQIVKQMRSNDQLGWTFVTEAEAMDQWNPASIRSHIIPKDFSDDLAGVVTGARVGPSGVLRQRKSQRHRPQSHRRRRVHCGPHGQFHIRLHRIRSTYRSHQYG